MLFFEPVIFRAYLFYRSLIIPLWYYFLFFFISDKTDYSIIVMKNDQCKQYTLTTENYREISLTPFTTDYFLLVTHVSHTLDGLEKRYRVVHDDNFRIIPMQSWLQSNDQVNIIEEMYDINLSTSH